MDDRSSTRLSATHASAEAILATVRLARALTEAGERIDLAGLDDQIGRLCAGILDLPPDEGRALRAQLIALDQETEALRIALRGQAATSG